MDSASICTISVLPEALAKQSLPLPSREGTRLGEQLGHGSLHDLGSTWTLRNLQFYIVSSICALYVCTYIYICTSLCMCIY